MAQNRRPEKSAVDRIKARLYVAPDLAAGQTVGLDHGQAHYLRAVLRLQAGDEVALFNGRDGEWRARIEGLGKGWCSLQVAERRRDQSDAADIWLVFAPIKRTRIDLLAEKATELGVAALWPVFTDYTAVSRVNAERLRANATEAAEQAGRLDVPEVMDPAPLGDAIARWPADRRLVICDEQGGGRPIADVCTELRATGAAAGPVALLTGPEGGFSRSELDAIRVLPFVTAVDLGPRVLRSDTAAIAALACWQAIVGDWRGAG